MSPWRDWVIKAFNENLPYDEFIRQQIAGDLLPNATPETILATAFNRLHRQTNEGGSIEEEYRVEYASDRLHTAGTAFLGLTFECSRCHDHKYDPITQKDYYSMTAFFNSIDESGLYSHFTKATPTPTLLLYDDETQRTRHDELRAQILENEKKLTEINRVLRSQGPLKSSEKEAIREFTFPGPAASFPFDQLADKLSPNLVSTNSAEFIEEPPLIKGRSGRAVQFSGDNSVVCKNVGNFNRTESFSIALWLKRTEEQERAIILHHSRAWTDSGSRGYEFVLENGQPFFGLIHFWPGNAIAIRGTDPIPLNEWVQIALTYDGSSNADGLNIFVNGVAAKSETVRDNLYRDITHRAQWGDSDVGSIHLTLGGRFRDSGIRNGAIDDLQVYATALTPLQVHALYSQSTSDDWQAEELLALSPAIVREYLATQSDEFENQLSMLQMLRAEENELSNGITEIMAMRDLPEQRPTFLLERGAYDSHGEPVIPDTPKGIMPFSDKLPRNRLGLATWLTDDANPLVARIAVNRVWKEHFGQGIVATVEDFGNQGALPTHPELLDWLAGWFVENDWNIKALHKLVVTSATYRQRSTASPALLARDPENSLLARGPRHRLEAEMIRDNALAVSGLLSRKIGGPSVKPYQPTGLWKESGTGKTYVQDHGEKLYRRSLYTFRRRTSPPPSMLTFDGTSREVCTARREVTSTPLQSLILMNDPQFIEASRVLAEKLVAAYPGNPAARIGDAFRQITGREPDKHEVAILAKLYAEQCEEYSKHQDAAKDLTATGEFPVNEKLPSIEVAATTMLVSTLMNFDEFIVKR